MAVINLQRRARELGRIRMGDKGPRGQPQRLSAFRLTSPDKPLLDAAAALYGGEVRPWKDQPGQFELYTTASELPCMVAPQEVTQFYELWSGGGCQRRCDGAICTIAGKPGEVDTVPCLCDEDNRECKLSTRLSVMLHELPGMGVWRLETHGFYAATELPASAELLVNLAKRGTYAPAALALEERIVKRNGQTKKFPVPVIRIKQALATLMTGEVIEARPALIAGVPALPSNGNGNGYEDAPPPPEEDTLPAGHHGGGSPNNRKYWAALNEHTDAFRGKGERVDQERYAFNGLIVGMDGPAKPTRDWDDRKWARFFDRFDEHCQSCSGGRHCSVVKAARAMVDAAPVPGNPFEDKQGELALPAQARGA